MPFTPAFKTIPKDVVEWAKYLRAVENAAGSVSNEQLRDSEAVSVIGRASNTAGSPADIEASANDQFLVRRSNALTFGTLVDADIPATIARDTEVTSAITAHEALADPHPGYLTPAEGNAAYVQVGAIPILPTYTVATVPSAATYARGLIYVSDEVGGAVVAFSDSTNWRRVTDRAIVS